MYIDDVLKKFNDRYHEIPEFWLFFIGLMGINYDGYYIVDIPTQAPSAILKQINMYVSTSSGISDHPSSRLLGWQLLWNT